MNDNTTGLSHEQLGKALYVLHHLVWPANWGKSVNYVDGKKVIGYEDSWSFRAHDDNVPFFGFAAEQAFDPRYRTHPLVELRHMIDRLDDLYKEQRPFYDAADITPYAKTLAGIEVLLGKKVEDFDIGCAHASEKPLTLRQATQQSYHPLKNNHAELASFDKLIALAHSAITRKMDCPNTSFFAKYYDEESKKGPARYT